VAVPFSMKELCDEGYLEFGIDVIVARWILASSCSTKYSVPVSRFVNRRSIKPVGLGRSRAIMRIARPERVSSQLPGTELNQVPQSEALVDTGIRNVNSEATLTPIQHLKQSH
jgi:hypothetical protein